MFLKFIKSIGLKKNIKKSLAQYEPEVLSGMVNTIGVLTDETYVADTRLIDEIARYGFKKEAVSLLVYRKKVSAKEAETINYRYFTKKDISAGGDFKGEAAGFINTPFDLLISYYDVEKPVLVLATLQSKAKFKVGFSSVNKLYNSFTINITADKYKEFIAELFKYLKILNKI